MSSEAQPLVSVITPMYNEAEHLAECIESIAAQTYQNWELIIVDNCSTDSSVNIARRYAGKDQRIRISQNRQFLSAISNHNAALREISSASRYCKVVFADDWIFPECLERMITVAETNPSVGIVGAYGLEGRQVVWTGLPYPSTMVPGYDVCRRLFLEGLYVFGTATSLLYRADLVRSHEPFFNEANIHADMEVCIALLKSCNFGFVHQVLTVTRARQGSRVTVSRNINTLAASKLYQLAKYGLDFLTPTEFNNCVRNSLSEYYWYLAGNALRRRSKSFWVFHEKALCTAGVGYDRRRLVRTVIVRLCLAGLNPKRTIKTLLAGRLDESEAFRMESLNETEMSGAKMSEVPQNVEAN